MIRINRTSIHGSSIVAAYPNEKAADAIAQKAVLEEANPDGFAIGFTDCSNCDGFGFDESGHCKACADRADEALVA